jgi:hypothetical protein
MNIHMQRARHISGLTVHRNQGGGDKKQGLPITIGAGVNSVFLLKTKVGYCQFAKVSTSNVCAMSFSRP